MKKPKIAVIGHVSLDITPEFLGENVALHKLLQPGKLISVGKAEIAPGGCVSNTGLALHKFGADVVLMAKIGKDAFGDMVIESYRKHGVEPEFIISAQDGTSYTIVIAIKGSDRIFLHDSGANHTFCEEDIDYGKIAGADFVHFGYPTLMRAFYGNQSDQLRRMFVKIKEQGMLTGLDLAAIDPESDAAKTDWEAKLRQVLPYVDFFVPSFEELLFMLDRGKYERLQGRDACDSLSLEEDIVPLAKKALSLGTKAVLLKCGAAGMFLLTAGKDKLHILSDKLEIEAWSDIAIFEESYVPDRILSATGAGDTSIAAFIYGICQELKPKSCLELAAGSGASCITEYDPLSGLLSMEELRKKIDSGWQKQHLLR